jgi:RimJ/RimL family protein N-acetyltransferase
MLALPLHTERTVLRLLRGADLQRFAACRADPVLARYQGWSPMTEDQARAFIAEMGVLPALGTGRWHQIAIAERTSDLLLGDIGLCGRENGEVELGFTLLHDAQGRGFATEALQRLVQALFVQPEVACIVAETDERNHASIRVLARLGMTQVLRRDAVFKNEACVELRYLLRREPA